jgi:hypothetical protein
LTPETNSRVSHKTAEQLNIHLFEDRSLFHNSNDEYEAHHNSIQEKESASHYRARRVPPRGRTPGTNATKEDAVLFGRRQDDQ